MRVQSSERGRRDFHSAWPLRFRTLECQYLPRLAERSRYDCAAILNIRPAQRQDLASARAGGGGDFQERCHAPRPGCRLEDQSLLRRSQRYTPMLLGNRRLAACDEVAGDQPPLLRPCERARDQTSNVPDGLRAQGPSLLCSSVMPTTL